jgi:hypothetical protein
MAERKIRQGDVLLIPIAKRPEGSIRIPGLMVARGEATGHHHQFAAQSQVELYRHGEDLFVHVEKPAVLQHEEHRAVFERKTVPAGEFQLLIQQELDLLGQVKRVTD